jgi:hypothetical protein
MMPTITVPIDPKINPPFLKAIGIARTPVPRLLLSKCMSEPMSLQQELNGLLNTLPYRQAFFN